MIINDGKRYFKFIANFFLYPTFVSPFLNLKSRPLNTLSSGSSIRYNHPIIDFVSLIVLIIIGASARPWRCVVSATSIATDTDICKSLRFVKCKFQKMRKFLSLIRAILIWVHLAMILREKFKEIFLLLLLYSWRFHTSLYPSLND